MTLALFVIGVIALAGFACLGIALCNRDAEWMVGAAGFLILAIVAAGMRAESMENNRRYDICVKEKKQVINILGNDVCRL